MLRGIGCAGVLINSVSDFPGAFKARSRQMFKDVRDSVILMARRMVNHVNLTVYTLEERT